MTCLIFLKCPKAHSASVSMKLTALIWSFIRVVETVTEIVEIFFLCIFRKFVNIFKCDKRNSSIFFGDLVSKNLMFSVPY